MMITADCSPSQQELSHKKAQYLVKRQFVSLSELLVTIIRGHDVLLQAIRLKGFVVNDI
jgi:hypothetical protein